MANEKGSPRVADASGVSTYGVEIIRDQRVVLRRMYLENRKHRLFNELVTAMDFARMWRREEVLYLGVTGLFAVERRDDLLPDLPQSVGGGVLADEEKL